MYLSMYSRSTTPTFSKPKRDKTTAAAHLEWRGGERFARCRCHVVLQGVGEIVGVGVEEVLGEVDELK